MMSLTVQTLGIPEVRFQEKPLKFRSRKAVALLIFLAVEREAHSREKLIDLLWSQADSRQGRVSLRTALSQLRHALRIAESSGIVTTNDLVQLDAERPFHLDLHHITAALLPEATVEDWQTAVSTNRSDFLEGFSLADAPIFDEWASNQRQLWHSRIGLVLRRLTTHQLDRGQGIPAAQTAAQWIAHSPLNETAYRCLMEAQALTGDRAAALQTYSQCQHTLQAELNIAPSPELAALAQRIKDLRLGIGSFNRQSKNVNRQSNLPFVGRGHEYSQLVTALRTAVQGATVVTAVIGAAGVGKTHLVEAFLNGSQLAGIAVDTLHGRAYEMGGHLPYQPLVTAFRARVEQENAPEDLLDDVWLAELSHLLPELRGRYPDLPAPSTGDPDFIRARLFESVARLGNALAAQSPLILFIDDLQWAESSTLDLLHYLCQSWAATKTPLLLVLTVRYQALITMPALRDWLEELGRAASLSRLELADFTAVDVQQLVNELAASAPSNRQTNESNAVHAFADWLYQETGGQPFFLNELVKMLAEQAILQPIEHNGRFRFNITTAWQQLQSQPHLAIPPNVRQMLLAQQNRLSEDALGLLWAAAVLGRDCSFERLCQVSGVTELVGLSALEGLLNGRFLLEISSAQRPYTFAHDHIREVAYGEAGEARRRLFHRRALAALEQDQSPPAELAFHALGARLDGPACRYLVAAGDAAKQAHAYAEAITHYDQARELVKATAVSINSGQAIDSQLLQRLYTNRGRSLELSQQYESVQRNYQEMIDLADDRNDPAMRLAALTSQCIVQATQTPLFNLSEARALAEEALPLARHLNDKVTEAKVLWGMLLVETGETGNNDKALAYGLRSLELARELDLKEQLGFTYQDLAHVYRYLNQLADAQKANQAALTIWQELGNLPMMVDAYTMQHLNHFVVGELAASLSATEEALHLSRSISHKWGQVVSLGYMIGALIEIGDPGRAAEMISKRKRLTEAVGTGFHPTFKYLIHQHQLSLALSLGVGDRVAQLTAELYENRHKLIPGFFQYMMGVVIQVKVFESNLKQAQQIGDEILLDWQLDKSSIIVAGSLSAAELNLLLAQNDYHLALQRAQDIGAHFRRTGGIVYLPEILWLQGRAEMGLKQWTQADETLAEALIISQRNGEHRLRWRILSGLSDIAKAQGKQPEAERYRKMGQEVVTTIANHIDDEELRIAFLATTAVQQLFPANK